MHFSNKNIIVMQNTNVCINEFQLDVKKIICIPTKKKLFYRSYY